LSRARPIVLPEELHSLVCDDGAFDDGYYWLDVSRNGEQATSGQLELLAAIEDVEIDDLLDSVVTQGEILRRLRDALGQGPIPADVLARQAERREARKRQPACRLCGTVGNSTKHHFVNRWILRELADYARDWSDRTKNCVPLCVDCHRDIHQRGNADKSMVGLLSDDEVAFVDAALSALAEERPRLLILIAHGDTGTYESKLLQDWIEGKFSTPR
jgi:hypothetical protein